MAAAVSNLALLYLIFLRLFEGISGRGLMAIIDASAWLIVVRRFGERGNLAKVDTEFPRIARVFTARNRALSLKADVLYFAQI
jgi:hypothetical protein